MYGGPGGGGGLVFFGSGASLARSPVPLAPWIVPPGRLGSGAQELFNISYERTEMRESVEAAMGGRPGALQTTSASARLASSASRLAGAQLQTVQGMFGPNLVRASVRADQHA